MIYCEHFLKLNTSDYGKNMSDLAATITRENNIEPSNEPGVPRVAIDLYDADLRVAQQAATRAAARRAEAPRNSALTTDDVLDALSRELAIDISADAQPPADDTKLCVDPCDEDDLYDDGDPYGDSILYVDDQDLSHGSRLTLIEEAQTAMARDIVRLTATCADVSRDVKRLLTSCESLTRDMCRLFAAVESKQ